MSDRDFFREVDQAVRQDQYKVLWDRYGVYALFAAALIVAGVAGYKGWSYWQESQAQAAGTEFSKALVLQDSGDAAKAQDAFATLAEKGPAGYRVLSRFQLASGEAQAGNKDKAVALFDALATDADTDNILKGLATIQSATLRLDTADYAEMERRLKGLIDQGSPWRYSAREQLGLSAYRLNNLPEAEKQFRALIGDQGTPSNLRERADVMLALILGAPQSLSTTAK
jgi:hypothetical protein